MSQQIPGETKQGVFYALSAFTIWGLNPIFFKWVKEVPVYEILAHRIVWMVSILFVMMILTRRTAHLKPFITDKRMVGMLFITAILVSTNWFVFTWAVMNDRVLHTSMGYFINPLVNVLLGMLFLGERLRPGQALSVALAFFGVTYMIVARGSLPWVSLALPFRFGMYGLLRKKIAIDAYNGLLLEGMTLVPISLGYLIYLHSQGNLMFTQGDFQLKGLLIFCGVVSLVPLMFFTAGVRRIPYSTIGIMQYTAPSMTFLFSIFMFKEELDRIQLTAFIFIWISLIIFLIEGLLNSRKTGIEVAKLSEAVES
jgi:chloramphenicol-sensitive protein RarD